MHRKFLSGVGVIGIPMSCVGSMTFAENRTFAGFENECKMRHMRSDTPEAREDLFDMVKSGKNKVLVGNVIKSLAIDKDGHFWYKSPGGSTKLDVQLQFYNTIRIVSGIFPNDGGRDHLYGDYGNDVSAKEKYPVLYNLCNGWREEKIAELEREDKKRAAWVRGLPNAVLTKDAADVLIYYILIDLVDRVNRDERVTAGSTDL